MLDFTKIEAEMREHWKNIGLLKLLQEKNKDGEKYYMLDGPPYANNVPHVGHLRNTVYKDLIIRVAYMKGHDVLWQPGFDTHGLPIENMVEKKLDLKSKKDIIKLGIDNFCKECKKLAATNKDLWMNVYDKLGTWYSWKEPYLTYKDSYVESAWWSFNTLWERKLVYEGKKPVHWCPKCETALAGYEVTDSYAMVTDPQIFVKFKVKDKDEYLLVYTTTPWTLISNVAIAVHPDETYVRVGTSQGTLILGKERLNILQDFEIGYKLIDEFKGNELDQLEYEPLLDLPVQQKVKDNKNAHKVYMSIPMLKGRVASKIATKKAVDISDDYGDFVTMEEGTGLVHTAPGHGKTDNEFGQHYHLPAVSPLDDECKYTEDAGEFKGRFVKECDADIITRLENEHKMVYSGKLQHKYPLCWRCKSKLIFRLSNQWFLHVDPIKDTMLQANKEVDWWPDYAQDKFHKWVSDAEDWNVSRQRYWGIPLPIWRCECGKFKCIGSRKELNENAVDKVDDDFDLHAASLVKFKCECGKTMSRVNDIADVWYDSGCAPFASLGYPFQNKSTFDSYAPVARINESQDQIRGWFYSLMFVGVGTFNKTAYKGVSMPGWVVDARGDKMSKSVGNVIWADEGIKMMGADVMRYYFCWDIAPYDLQKFNLDTGKKECGKILNILWNLSTFSAGDHESSPKEIEDEWILSRFNSVIKNYCSAIDNFEYHNAARELGSFIVDDVSRWYVQVCRDRLDNEDTTPLGIINKIILTLVKALAPVTPHMSEYIYQNLANSQQLKKSVHLEEWPKHDESYIKAGLDIFMGYIQEIVAGILHAREKLGKGVRWPVAKVEIVIEDKTKLEEVKRAVDALGSIIKKQANVREIILSDHIECKFDVKPDYAKIRQDFSEQAKKIIEFLKTADINNLLDDFDKKKLHEVDVDGETKNIVKEHVIVNRICPDNLVEGKFKFGYIYLDKTTTPELEAEGYAREVTRRIQQLRKKSGLSKDQKVKVFLECDDELKQMLAPHLKQLNQKVGADMIDFTSKQCEFNSQEKVKGKEFSIALELL